MPAAALTAALDRAVTSGCLDPQVVLIDACRDTSQVAPVVPIGALTGYDRPAPSLADYDTQEADHDYTTTTTATKTGCVKYFWPHRDG